VQKGGYFLLSRKHLVISCLLIALLLALYYLNQRTEASSVKAAIATHNVFHDSFEKDWATIHQVIDPENKMKNYIVNEFDLQYSPKGDITSLSWSFESPVQDGKQWEYAILHDGNEPEYTILVNRINPLPAPVQGQITMNDFVKLISTKTIQTMTPNSGDGVSMHFSRTFQKMSVENLKDTPTSYYVIRDEKVIGPVKQGEGYVMTVFSMNRETDDSMSGQFPHYYFLGGTV
jgi:hypothetical protein